MMCPVPARMLRTKDNEPANILCLAPQTTATVSRTMAVIADNQNPLRGARLNNREIRSLATARSGSSGGKGNSNIGIGAQCIATTQCLAKLFGEPNCISSRMARSTNGALVPYRGLEFLDCMFLMRHSAAD